MAAVSTELVDPHSLSLSDAVDASSLRPADHGDDWPPPPATDEDRCILAPLGGVPFLRLGCRSSASARCRGALWDRALARDDSVLAM